MMIDQHIESALASCGAEIESGDEYRGLVGLVADLAAVRALDPLRWRAELVDARRWPVHTMLCEDPYTRDAFHKPRGYAGDAGTLDYVYRFRGPDGATELGRRLFAVTTSVPIATAVRERCEHVAHAIRERLRAGDATILSVGSGHMRELQQVAAVLLGHGRFVAVDQDAASLDALPHLHPGVNIVGVRCRIRELLTGRLALPRADLIYASGLFDYLPAEAARALVRSLSARLEAGGTLIVANLTGANPEIGYMEAVMNWWMHYRSAEALLAVAQPVAPSFAIKAYETSEGRVAWLHVTRG
jgi:extracellular factor (EF) 3-hydroxypalmitic acid methyl ester biosynthesis protein